MFYLVLFVIVRVCFPYSVVWLVVVRLIIWFVARTNAVNKQRPPLRPSLSLFVCFASFYLFVELVYFWLSLGLFNYSSLHVQTLFINKDFRYSRFPCFYFYFTFIFHLFLSTCLDRFGVVQYLLFHARRSFINRRVSAVVFLIFNLHFLFTFFLLFPA